MSGSDACQVELGGQFEASVLRYEKATYPKDQRGREASREILAKIIEQFYALNSPKIPQARFEPFPPGSVVPNAQLWKVSFNAPHLAGPAQCGRVVYLFFLETRTIVPLCVYTHKQFPGVVPSKDLKSLIEEATKANGSTS